MPASPARLTSRVRLRGGAETQRVDGERFVAVPRAVGAAPPQATPHDPGLWGELAGLLVPELTDLFVNGDGSVWTDLGDGPRAVPGLHLPADVARRLAMRLVAAGDRHVDESTPCQDVRLPGGLRVHAVLPPIARGGALISVRQARRRPLTLAELEAAGACDAVSAERVRELVARRANLLITGAAGSGKTTLLAALLAEASPAERILLIEDVAELRLEHPQLVCLEARQANLDGAGAIALPQLVREALRMRPDRIVIGEVRGAEFRELLQALNTGHDGGAGTLHANSLDDVPARLEALGALAGLDAAALARQVVSAFDAVIHVERDSRGVRRLVAIGELVLDAERVAVRAWE